MLASDVKGAATRNKPILDENGNRTSILKLAGMNSRYKPPTAVWTTKWDAYQFGWSPTCRRCNQIWCVVVIRIDATASSLPAVLTLMKENNSVCRRGLYC